MSDVPLNPDGSEWVPAFPGQRPPFQRGNRVSVGNRGPRTHGANSPAVYSPLAAQIRADLLKTPGLDYLADSSFRDLLHAYSTAEARWRLYGEWVDAQPLEVAASDAKGTPPFEMLREMDVRLANLAERLGLTPVVPDEVRDAITAARTRLALKRERAAEKKDLRANMVKAMWRAESPEDFGADGELRPVEDRLRDLKGDR